MPTLPQNELEIKILEVDVDALLKNLHTLGATEKYSTEMKVITFDILNNTRSLKFTTNDKPLSAEINKILAVAFDYYQKNGALKSNNAHLRLRHRSDRSLVELCFKHSGGSHGRHKLDLEYNLGIPYDVAAEIEKKAPQIGMYQVALHEKKRRSYVLPINHCVCDIDTYPGIPTYAEIEHPDPNIIEATIKLLGLSSYKRSTKSGQAFFADYNLNYYSSLTF